MTPTDTTAEPLSRTVAPALAGFAAVAVAAVLMAGASGLLTFALTLGWMLALTVALIGLAALVSRVAGR